MTEAMTAIYTAIGELMAGCIKELRASNKACILQTSEGHVAAQWKWIKSFGCVFMMII